MKVKHIIGVCILLLSLTKTIDAQNYQKTEMGIKTNVCAMDVEIQFYSPKVVRVVKSRNFF